MTPSPSIVWLRNDLRLADNPALHAALKRGGPVIAVFIWAPDEEGEWRPGAASRWWLHQSLERLGGELERLGVPLVLRLGPSSETLQLLSQETCADAVFWNRRYEPPLIERDQKVDEQLRARDCRVHISDSTLLFDPWTIRNKSNQPFQVFAAFWRACLTLGDAPEPLASPRKLIGPTKTPQSLALAALKLEPRINWAAGFAGAWEPGEAGAANNTLGWQWTAGCVADSVPFFRIFNPVSQGEGFDPKGDYIRRWVPEIAGLPDQWIHRPWLSLHG